MIYTKPILTVVNFKPFNSLLAGSAYGEEGAAGNLFDNDNTNDYGTL